LHPALNFGSSGINNQSLYWRHANTEALIYALPAQSCRSRKLSTLRRNFPEADIRAGAQHFATLDDCNAD
jgi:hypothetical protein